MVLGENTQKFINTAQPTGEIIGGKHLSVLYGQNRPVCNCVCRINSLAHSHTTHTQAYKVIHEL